MALVLVLVAVLGLIGSGTSAGAASDADADAGTVLPFHHFEHLATDRADDTAYADGWTSDSGAGKVAVVDASGAVDRTFDDLTFPSGMTLSTDRATLFVAAHVDQRETIVSIDVRTGVRRLYDLGESDTCDADLALVDDQVWFAACPAGTGRGTGGLGVLDPGSGSVHYSHVVDADVEKLASDPAVPHRLLVGAADGLYSLDIADVSGDEPSATVAAESTLESTLANYSRSLSLSPDGSQVLVGESVLRTSDLAVVDSYPADGDGTSAESADGTVAVGGSDEGPYTGALFVYRPGHTVFAQRTDYGLQYSNESVFVAWGGLGFGRTSLFAVTWSGHDQDGADPVIHVTRPDPPPDPIGLKDLNLLDVGQLVSDPPHAQEFVSTGVNDNGLIVLDDTGRVTHVIQHLPGISEITRSGDTLWMSLEGGDALAAMDTRTYAVHKYVLGAGSAPVSVAVAAGKVWFSHNSVPGRDFTPDSSLGTLDPATGQVHRDVATILAYDLVATPLHPHSVYGLGVTFPGSYEFPGTPEIRIKVTGGAQPTAIVAAAQDVGNMTYQAIETPDLLHLAYAGGYVTSNALDPLSMAGVDSPNSRDGGLALATRSDGLVARSSAHYIAPDVVMRFGALGPRWRKVFLPVTGGGAVPYGLAFGSTNLYVLVHHGGGVDYHDDYFHLVEVPAPERQKISVTTNREYYSPGNAVRLVAHVEPRLLTQHPRVSVEEHPRDGSTRTLVTGARPDAHGNVDLSTTFGRPVTFYAQVRYGNQTARFNTCRNIYRDHFPCEASDRQ